MRGTFAAAAGASAEVKLEGAVAEGPLELVQQRTPTGLTVTSLSGGDPARAVKAFAPIDLYGELDSGDRVSLLAAQNHGAFEPHYLARAAVVGAHVSSDQLYSGIRFRIDHPYWTAHLADGEGHALPDDGSVLRVTAPEKGDNRGTWLVYESAQPRSLLELESRVLAGCLTLARLVLDLPVTLRTTEIRISPDGEWLPLHSKRLSAPASGIGQSLLPREQLTVERFADWIALNDTLDGLASAVYGLDEGSGTVQSQVLIGTSLVEGLHRRLPYEQSQFPEASNSAREHVKKAARRAAAERAMTVQKMDSDLVHTAVKDAIGHFEDVGYRARAQDIINDITGAVPELTESIPDLAGKLMTARNELAHHLVLSGEKEPFGDRINRWVAISYVTPWLLRLLLLLHVGIEPDSLRTACLDSDKFGFLRANLAAIADDLGWLPASELLPQVTRHQ